MSDLIKREDAIKITWEEPYYSDPINVLSEVRDRIKALPTVDAVAVCRCRDCKWCEYPAHNSTKYGCKLFDRCVKPDWFCADGKRKDGADDV